MNRKIGIFVASIMFLIFIAYYCIKESISVNWFWILIALLVLVLVILIMIIRIKYILSRAYGIKIGFSKLVKVFFMSKIIYLLIPKMNILVRGFLFNRYLKVPIGTALSALSIETALDGTFQALMALVFVLIFSEYLPESTPIAAALVFCLLAVFSIMIAILLNKGNKFSNFLNSKFGDFKNKLLKRLSKLIINFTTSLEKGSKLFITKRYFLPLSLFSLSIFVFGILRLWFVFEAFGLDVPLSLIFFASSISIFIGWISFIPGGIGVREVTAVAIYSSAGFHPAIATITLALIFDRIIFSAFITAVGGYFGVANYKTIKEYLKNLKEKQPEKNENVKTD